MNKYVLFTILAVALATFNSSAQVNEKLKNQEVVRSTILKNGKSIEGYFEKVYAGEDNVTYDAPGHFKME